MDGLVRLLKADPRPWLLASDEAPARWLALAELSPAAAPEEARVEVAASPMVAALFDRLPGWGEGTDVSGHDSPGYLPNMLDLLADLGVREGDDPRVARALDQVGGHTYPDGRFLGYGRAPSQPEPVWGSLPCDTHLIADVLARFGRGDTPVVEQAVERIVSDLIDTNQGRGWTCIPDPAVGFRGPGRKGDVCPQVTVEALRLLARLDLRPPGLDDALHTVLAVWSNRGAERPYMFGHGSRFKVVKWPPLWYGAHRVLDALGRYDWRGAAGPERGAVAELVACLVAYNVASDGTVTPRSVYRGFEGFSFGQKKRPSPVATALLATVVNRFVDLADEVDQVDVTRLTSSKGGTGVARPPRCAP